MTGPVAVKIEPLTLADVLLAVDKNPVEVSGLVKTEKISDLAYLIKGEPLIVEQECSSSHTDFTVPYGHWTQKMMREKRDREIKDYRTWFHSHAHGRVGFSEVDFATIESWSGTLDEWWLSWVLNKRGQMEMRLDIFAPERETVSIRRVELAKTAGKEEIRRLMIERSERMDEILLRNVRNVDGENKPFEKILRGMFDE